MSIGLSNIYPKASVEEAGLQNDVYSYKIGTRPNQISGTYEIQCSTDNNRCVLHGADLGVDRADRTNPIINRISANTHNAATAQSCTDCQTHGLKMRVRVSQG